MKQKGIQIKRGAVLLKGCPRCGGDLTTDEDIHGEYVKCLQCARTIDQPKRFSK